MKPTQQEFTGQKPFCDLVLKGAINSDVVYPLAIVGLAKRYRFGSIGGTSSGALAAAITAAGEFARDSGGFLRIAEIPDKVADTIFDQLQPKPELKPLFDMFTATQSKEGKKAARVIFAAVRGYPKAVLIGLLPGFVVAAIALASANWSWLVTALLLALFGLGLSLGARLRRAILKELPDANYGLCSGLTMPGGRGPAFTDWQADTIDYVAAKKDAQGRFGAPLTFGDLRRHTPPIDLAMIVTDLGTKRPYQLPFTDKFHFFSKGDFEKLFPERIIRHMCEHTSLLPDAIQNAAKDLYYFPETKDVPVVVAARMSQSFPLIIQAVPIYKCDATLLKQEDRDKPRKSLFSDGGLTSNFPIHLFDRLLPNSPTFAISLDAFSKERNGEGKNEIRVDVDDNPSTGQFLPIDPIKGLLGFLQRLFTTATDWQDSLQSVLPGYRERIVHVYLKENEGGLNPMSPPMVKNLAKFGEMAAQRLERFDMDEHRWRRFLVAMADIEQMLDDIARSYNTSSVPGQEFGTFLAHYGFNGNYPPISPEWKETILRRAKSLVELGDQWRNEPTIRSGRIPQPERDLRLVAKQ